MITPLWISSVTIGSPDPRAAAQFYHRLLGWEVTAEDPPGEGKPPRPGGPSSGRRRVSGG